MPGVTVQTQTLIKVALKSDEPLISLLTEMVHLLDEDRYLAAGKLLEQIRNSMTNLSSQPFSNEIVKVRELLSGTFADSVAHLDRVYARATDMLDSFHESDKWTAYPASRYGGPAWYQLDADRRALQIKVEALLPNVDPVNILGLLREGALYEQWVPFVASSNVVSRVSRSRSVNMLELSIGSVSGEMVLNQQLIDALSEEGYFIALNESVVPSKGSGGGGGDGIERFQLENCDFIIEPVGTASVQVKVLVKWSAGARSLDDRTVHFVVARLVSAALSSMLRLCVKLEAAPVGLPYAAAMAADEGTYGSWLAPLLDSHLDGLERRDAASPATPPPGPAGSGSGSYFSAATAATGAAVPLPLPVSFAAFASPAATLRVGQPSSASPSPRPPVVAPASPAASLFAAAAAAGGASGRGAVPSRLAFDSPSRVPQTQSQATAGVRAGTRSGSRSRSPPPFRPPSPPLSPAGPGLSALSSSASVAAARNSPSLQLVAVRGDNPVEAAGRRKPALNGQISGRGSDHDSGSTADYGEPGSPGAASDSGDDAPEGYVGVGGGAGGSVSVGLPDGSVVESVFRKISRPSSGARASPSPARRSVSSASTVVSPYRHGSSPKGRRSSERPSRAGASPASASPAGTSPATSSSSSITAAAGRGGEGASVALPASVGVRSSTSAGSAGSFASAVVGAIGLTASLSGGLSTGSTQSSSGGAVAFSASVSKRLQYGSVVFYNVVVASRGTSSNVLTERSVLRRYSDFLSLHQALSIRRLVDSVVPFPPKFHCSNFVAPGERSLDARQKGLNSYLKQVLSNAKVLASSEIRDFLGLDAFRGSSSEVYPRHN